MANPLSVINPRAVTVRHVVRTDKAGAPVASESGVSPSVTVLGKGFVGTAQGLGGDRGFTAGSYELRLQEEGRFTLRFPNAAGEDGLLHRTRFACLTDDSYAPGDEWIEVYADDGLLFVGTPVEWRKSQDSVEIMGYDAHWILNLTRETTAGFWAHAPRDVWEHYTTVWKSHFADDLSDEAVTFVNDETVRTTGDSRWDYKRAGTLSVPGPGNPPAGRVRLSDTLGFGTDAFFRLNAGVADLVIGSASAEPRTAWRFEGRIFKSKGWDTTMSASVELQNLSGTMIVQCGIAGETTGRTHISFSTLDLIGSRKVKISKNEKGPWSVAIEGRGRWIFCYFNGVLVQVLPMITGPETVVPAVRFNSSLGGATQWLDVSSFFVKRTRPFLMYEADWSTADGGDLMLGLAQADLSAGELRADYYDDNDLKPYNAADTRSMVLNPSRVPYIRKLEDNIDFGNTSWQPPGPGGDWSARFHGCVYLDLAARDIKLGLTPITNGRRYRLWVGFTGWGKQLLDAWAAAGTAGVRGATVSLRASLGSVSGWFPIIVETTQASSTAGLKLEYTTDGAMTVWATVPSTLLSPIGCVVDQFRFESHYELLRSLAETWGYQFSHQPRSLESGRFPGNLAPHLRVGRDTEKVIQEDETTAYEVRGSASDRADALFADGGGIVDANEGSQPTAEIIDFARADSLLFLRYGYESLTDLTWKPLIERRLDSLLALRRNVFEEPQAKPSGAKELLDSFPLTGALSAFDWAPGDGVRLNLENIGIVDASPRPIFGVTRDFVPDSLGGPSVSFRPRPRNMERLLKDIQATGLRASRARRPSSRTLIGSVGGRNNATYPDTFSRLPMPEDGESIVRLTFVVHEVAGSTWEIFVLGNATGLLVTTPGRYDVTGWAEQDDAAGAGSVSNKRIQARLNLSSGAGGDVISYQLEADVTR